MLIKKAQSKDSKLKLLKTIIKQQIDILDKMKAKTHGQ